MLIPSPHQFYVSVKTERTLIGFVSTLNITQYLNSASDAFRTSFKPLWWQSKHRPATKSSPVAWTQLSIIHSMCKVQVWVWFVGTAIIYFWKVENNQVNTNLKMFFYLFFCFSFYPLQPMTPKITGPGNPSQFCTAMHELYEANTGIKAGQRKKKNPALTCNFWKNMTRL